MTPCININQAIALKHDRAACLTDRKETSLHREILDGRHIERYYTGESPNYFKFDVAKIHSCKREDIFLLQEKIFFRRVGERLIASLDTEKKFALNTLVVVSPKAGCPYSLRFVLALFNSKLLNYYYVNVLKSSKKVFSEIQARQIEQMPFPILNFSEAASKANYNRINTLVDSMLSLHKQLASAKSEVQKDVVKRQIDATDAEIDRILYDLYGLKADEIAIVEKARAWKRGSDSAFQEEKAPRADA